MIIILKVLYFQLVGLNSRKHKLKFMEKSEAKKKARQSNYQGTVHCRNKESFPFGKQINKIVMERSFSKQFAVNKFVQSTCKSNNVH